MGPHEMLNDLSSNTDSDSEVEEAAEDPADDTRDDQSAAPRQPQTSASSSSSSSSPELQESHHSSLHPPETHAGACSESPSRGSDQQELNLDMVEEPGNRCPNLKPLSMSESAGFADKHEDWQGQDAGVKGNRMSEKRLQEFQRTFEGDRGGQVLEREELSEGKDPVSCRDSKRERNKETDLPKFFQKYTSTGFGKNRRGDKTRDRSDHFESFSEIKMSERDTALSQTVSTCGPLRSSHPMLALPSSLTCSDLTQDGMSHDKFCVRDEDSKISSGFFDVPNSLVRKSYPASLHGINSHKRKIGEKQIFRFEETPCPVRPVGKTSPSAHTLSLASEEDSGFVDDLGSDRVRKVRKESRNEESATGVNFFRDLLQNDNPRRKPEFLKPGSKVQLSRKSKRSSSNLNGSVITSSKCRGTLSVKRKNSSKESNKTETKTDRFSAIFLKLGSSHDPHNGTQRGVNAQTEKKEAKTEIGAINRDFQKVANGHFQIQYENVSTESSPDLVTNQPTNIKFDFIVKEDQSDKSKGFRDDRTVKLTNFIAGILLQESVHIAGEAAQGFVKANDKEDLGNRIPQLCPPVNEVSSFGTLTRGDLKIKDPQGTPAVTELSGSSQILQSSRVLQSSTLKFPSKEVPIDVSIEGFTSKSVNRDMAWFHDGDMIHVEKLQTHLDADLPQPMVKEQPPMLASHLRMDVEKQKSPKSERFSEDRRKHCRHEMVPITASQNYQGITQKIQPWWRSQILGYLSRHGTDGDAHYKPKYWICKHCQFLEDHSSLWTWLEGWQKIIFLLLQLLVSDGVHITCKSFVFSLFGMMMLFSKSKRICFTITKTCFFQALRWMHASFILPLKMLRFLHIFDMYYMVFNIFVIKPASNLFRLIVHPGKVLNEVVGCLQHQIKRYVNFVRAIHNQLMVEVLFIESYGILWLLMFWFWFPCRCCCLMFRVHLMVCGAVFKACVWFVCLLCAGFRVEIKGVV